MPIRFSCACGRSIAVKDEHAGKLIKCPACAKPVRVPKEELDLKPEAGELAGSGLELKPEGLEAKSDPLAAGTKSRSRSHAVSKVVKAPAGGSAGTARSTAGGPRKSKSKTRSGKRPPPLGDDLMGGRVPPVTTRRQTEFEIKPMEGMTARGEKKSFKCPGCTATLYEGDILCIACGMDLSTGQWVAPKEVEPKGWIWLILGLLVVAGLIGGLIYVFKKSVVEASGPGPGAGGAGTGGAAVTAPPVDDAAAALGKLLAGGSMFDFKKVAEELGKLREEGLPTLLETWKGEGASANSKKVALYGMGLLARAGVWNDDVIAAFQTTVRDKASELRETALQGLYRIAFERADGPIEADEFRGTEGLFKGLKRMPAVSTVRAVFSEVAGDPADPLCAWAVRFATDLGDQTAVHVLISGLGNADLPRDAQERFKVMLRELTGATFDTPDQWENWWQERQSESPAQWLIRALEGQNDLLRAAAAKRLKRLTGANLPDWETAGTAEKRAELVKKWQAWGVENKGK
ncbi:MAG: hypothetical protein HZA54_14570 [Planctomycetes bacterium]|nr:hypothetical protein [Planctomycetota bacterium]